MESQSTLWNSCFVTYNLTTADDIDVLLVSLHINHYSLYINEMQKNDHHFPSGFQAWLQVVRCYQKTSQHLAMLLRPLDLTVAQHDVLANLYVEDGVSQQSLAQRLLVSKGNVTGLLNRLAERGLVERRSDPEDLRSNRIYLTETGRSLSSEALAIQGELVVSMMGGLSQEEQKLLQKLVRRIEAQVERLRQEVKSR